MCFLKTVLAQIVVGRLNDELQRLWLSWISSAALFNLRLLLSVGWNIYSKKWLHDLFFYEYSNISSIIFHSKLWVKHTFDEKELLCKIISLSTRETFFFKCQTLHISEINSFLDLKRNHLIQWYVAWINDFENTYFCKIVELISWRIKNNKTRLYAQI